MMWLDPKEPVKLGSPDLPLVWGKFLVAISIWTIPNESQVAWAYDLKYIITVAGFEGEVAGKFWQLLFAGCCLLELCLLECRAWRCHLMRHG